MDRHSSRLLDSMFIKSQKSEKLIEEDYEKAFNDIKNLPGQGDNKDFKYFITNMKREAFNAIKAYEERLKTKLIRLRAGKQIGRLPPGWSMGSRKIKGFSYIRDKNSGAVQGAPFPQNLRPHRQDRPHRRRYPSIRQHIITEEDLAARDPIILSKNPSFVLREAGRSLLRMSLKTCPTPTNPVDEKEIHKAWVITYNL